MFDHPQPLGATSDFHRRFRVLAGTVLIAAVLVGIHAALSQRALYADGAHYLLTMIETHQMTYPEASRRMIHTLQQWPAFLLLQSGIRDIHVLSVVYGLTVYLLPILLTAACYPSLPAARRGWFLFPLLNYLAGSTAAGFPGIVEGPLATAYFWLLLYVVTFLPETLLCKLITALLAVSALHTHEVFGFLAPVLALAAALRARRAESSWSADFYYIMMWWFIVVSAVQIRFVLVPIVPSAREGFFGELIHLVWLFDRDGRINVPAVLGLQALATMALAGVTSSRPGRHSRIQDLYHICMVVTCSLCVLAVASPFLTDLALFPGAQFAARNHPAFMAVPLAAMALASLPRPVIQRYWMQERHRIVLAFLAVGTLGWQAAATVRWTQYTHDFRTVLQRNTGLVPWTTAMRSLPEPRRSLFLTMYWPWTNPTLSILLSPDRRIRTLIANPEPVTWQPFDPADPKSLPRSDLFDLSDYANTLSPRGE